MASSVSRVLPAVAHSRDRDYLEGPFWILPPGDSTLRSASAFNVDHNAVEAFQRDGFVVVADLLNEVELDAYGSATHISPRSDRNGGPAIGS